MDFMTTEMPISLSCRVRYIEFVSTKFGISSSEPIAMISAESMESGKRLAGDAQRNGEKRSGSATIRLSSKSNARPTRLMPATIGSGLRRF